MIPQVLPTYPRSPSGSCGTTAPGPAPSSDDVHLVTTGIDAVTPTGVRTVDGVTADVLIYGTGFTASRFLTPDEGGGAGVGVDLPRDVGRRRPGYLGIAVPGFPNLFLLYGPNTNIVINGSIIYFLSGVRGPVPRRVPGDAAGRGPPGARRPPRGPRRLQPADRRRQPPAGLGRLHRQHLVPQRQGPDRPELAVLLLDYWRETRAPNLGLQLALTG